jgi:hypothetical protein
VIGCAITVHRALGAGLLESAYDRAFCIELEPRGCSFCDNCIARSSTAAGEWATIVSTISSKTRSSWTSRVERLDFVFVSQMLTYLKATGTRLGLILNFNVAVMKAGVKRWLCKTDASPCPVRRRASLCLRD